MCILGNLSRVWVKQECQGENSPLETCPFNRKIPKGFLIELNIVRISVKVGVICLVLTILIFFKNISETSCPYYYIR